MSKSIQYFSFLNQKLSNTQPMQNLYITISRTSLLPNNGDQIIDVLEPKLTQKCQNILN